MVILSCITLIDFIQLRTLHAYYEYLTAGNLVNRCFQNMIDTLSRKAIEKKSSIRIEGNLKFKFCLYVNKILLQFSPIFHLNDL